MAGFLALLFFLLLFFLSELAPLLRGQSVAGDPLVRMPGTQPSQGVALEAPDRCFNCHAGYDAAVEPGTNWQGSMMAQAARDPIFWACLTVAGQDSKWALGTPNAVDLCERCHFPQGWLAGRSDPPNASAMTGSDYDGVHCDVCHTQWDPFFDTTYNGMREGNNWSGYWDEAGNTGPGSGTASQLGADATHTEDQTLAAAIQHFSGASFYVSSQPRYPTYAEHGSGQYFMSPNAQKRASFADAAARHQMLYSRAHKSKYFCGTCHDVSNPVLANLGLSGLPDQSGGTHLITEQYSAAGYFHVERTFSEFLLSAYGQPGGAATNAEFQQQGAATITWAAKCQDCHLRDVTGVACNKTGAPLRPAGSTEHPNSGLPLHDMTGGNLWISRILASLDPFGPVFDPVNVQLLDQGPAVLTLDLNAGLSPKVSGAALLAGSERARQQLLLAATIQNLSFDPATGQLSFRIQNNTGHKLLSGFPEGRRLFVNIKVYSGAALMYEVNPYDYSVGTLKGQPGAPLGPNEEEEDELVYEVHPRSDLTGEEQTFHFVLATGRSKDNRIPPKGFDIASAPVRLSEPVWKGVSDASYFTPAEYTGGYDDVSLTLPTINEPDRVEVRLYYQGTSREYVQFLRDEINGTGGTLPNNGSNPYIIQTDPFFAKLKAWGDTIWELWRHNHGLDDVGAPLDGIVPFAIAEATWTVSHPIPAVTSVLSPSSVPAEATSFTLTVLGSGFVPASTVRWNGLDRPTAFISSSQLTASISTSGLPGGGSAAITVFNPEPGGGLSNAMAFAYSSSDNLAPVLTALLPAGTTPGRPGLTLVVEGRNFTRQSVVRWNGAGRPTQFLSAGRLSAFVPARDLTRPRTAEVTVETPGAGTSNVLPFSVGRTRSRAGLDRQPHSSRSRAPRR